MNSLSDPEICILALVEEGEVESTQRAVSQLGVPRRLLEMGLVVRDTTGNPVLTHAGRNALFRSRCIDALLRLDQGKKFEASAAVERWLRESRFLAVAGAGRLTQRALTSRGKEWLSACMVKQVPTHAKMTSRP